MRNTWQTAVPADDTPEIPIQRGRLTVYRSTALARGMR